MASFSVLTSFWIIKTSQSKEKSKEKQRKAKRSKEENRGQQLQSSLALLEHFPKSIIYMLYTISKLRKSRIQRFKPCMIWSWNEEDMAFGRQLLQACAKFAQHLEILTTPSGYAKFAQHPCLCEIRTSPCMVRILLCSADSTLDLFFCIFWCKFLSYPCN